MHDDTSVPAEVSDTHDPSARAATPSSNRWVARLVWILIVAAAIPAVYRFGRSEIGRWYHAASQDALYRGERSEALEKINKAVEWDPESLSLLGKQSYLLLSLRDTQQAVATADQALEIARQQRQLRDYEGTQFQLSSALNQSAYARALDESELTKALTLAEESVAIMDGFHLRDSGVLDTRGYLHYLLAMQDESIREEELEKATEDMEEAVKLNEQIVKRQLGDLRSQAKLSVDQTPLRFMRRQIDEGRAVLYQHRGLVYEAVGNTNAAEKDLARAKELGYDPENGVW